MGRKNSPAPISPVYIPVLLVLWLAACQKDSVEKTDKPVQATGEAAPAPDQARTVSPAAKEPPAAGLAWETELYFRTYSSPRLFTGPAGPGMLIAFGDENPRAGGAFAVDVASGQRLWRFSTTHELFTLPTPLPSTQGDVQPWVFAGRDGQLHAVDALTGEQIWQFSPAGDEGRATGIYNFYTGRAVGDADGDGRDDYLVTNGGDSRREPGESRPPGHLMVVSGADGRPIHRLQTPDGRETYCSPLIWQRPERDWVVFGTGGETFPGSLWAVPTDSLKAGTLGGIRALLEAVGDKGFVAPPSFADLDGDGVLDLIATPFDGRLVVLAGASLQTMWRFAAPDTEETQASPAIGDFDGDGDLDIATTVHKGIFPHWQGGVVRAFDGRTGAPLWEYGIDGDMIPPSPLAADIDADGRDEIFFVESEPGYFMGKASTSRLQVAHVEEKRVETLATVGGLSASSGWVGDADGDGWLEWFVPLSKIGRGGLLRYNLGRPAPQRIAWGGYLGTGHDGVY